MDRLVELELEQRVAVCEYLHEVASVPGVSKIGEVAATSYAAGCRFLQCVSDGHMGIGITESASLGVLTSTDELGLIVVMFERLSVCPSTWCGNCEWNNHCNLMKHVASIAIRFGWTVGERHWTEMTRK
uniref:Uncharacterized protein n=1 Tax=Noctiluca scintillans TaxID=2966 RepID=A0A7S1EZ45_NOCSC|mmetsp:Transcript_19196/g.51316  ORF Transcript_19196/g.51316 Transcript_19196/m.51316 type:complete len:129 (+) Transcript_19196:127-513(+)